ncbi:MAG: PQQ-binding-like beta-propeller repeat protein [Planctomycetia bacterium]|nr:PQQ-binding-like beta-propeller repeat protein [Planctomycetia bacterium]
MSRLASVVGLALVLCGPSAWSQSLNTQIVSEATARKNGLVRRWVVQVQVDGTRDAVQSVIYYQPALIKPKAAPQKPMPPMAEGGAPAAAEAQAPPAGEAAPAAGEAPPPAAPEQAATEQYVPGMLIVQTELGTIQALDAATGRSLWVTKVGDGTKVCENAAVSDDHVVILSGSWLYALDRQTGDVVWERRNEIVTVTAPAVTKGWVYVGGIKGDVFAYKLPERYDRPAPAPAPAAAAPPAAQNGAAKPPEPAAPRGSSDDTQYAADAKWNYASFGRIDVPPVQTRRGIVWATNRGFLYSSSEDKASVPGRFETRAAVTAPLAYLPPLIYVASRDGNIYAVRENLSEGSPWRFPLGEGVNQRPMAVNQSLFVITETKILHHLDAFDGTLLWKAPKIARVLATDGARRIYAMDQFGTMQILDFNTGSVLGQIAMQRLNVFLENEQSDLIVVGNRNGLLQCLQEPGHADPRVHHVPTAEEIRARPMPAKPAAEQPAAAAAQP